MSKSWFVKNGNDIKEFENYLDALKVFREYIRNYFYTNRDAFCSDILPFSFGVFFSAKYDSYEITDEDIVVQERTNLLLSSLRWEDIDEGEKAADYSIRNSYHFYEHNKEFGHSISADIDKEKDLIYLDFESNDNGDFTYLKSNAFVNKQEKNLYFIAKEIVTTSSNPENLGKAVELNLYLYSSENNNFDNSRINEKKLVFTIIEDVKKLDLDFLTISYIQRTYSVGFVKANRIFDKLIGYGMVEPKATGNKGNKVIKNFYERY